MDAICWECLGFILGSSIVGLLFGRLLFGANRRELLELQDANRRDKNDLNKIVKEYNQYKATATERNTSAEKEISLLKKSNQEMSNSIGKTNLSPLDKEKYIKLKKESDQLISEVNDLKSQLENSSSQENITAPLNAKIDSLKLQLKDALIKIKEQDKLIKRAKKETASLSTEEKDTYIAQIEKQKKKAKKYKKAIKELKRK